MDCLVIYEVSVKYKKRGTIQNYGMVTNSCRLYEYCKSIVEDNPYQEQFAVIGLDNQLQPKYRQIVSVGTSNMSLVGIPEVFRGVILANCNHIAICHNHPSGVLEASNKDVDITRRIKDAGKILGIELLDHIIISESGYLSMIEAGLI